MTDAEIAALDAADTDTQDMLKYERDMILASLPVTGNQCQCPECKPKSVAQLSESC